MGEGISFHFICRSRKAGSPRMVRLNYEGAVCLAPMVRVGSFPFRLTCLEYGADIVYTEEIIDKRMLLAQRVENAALGTVDMVDKSGKGTCFRSSRAVEGGRLVLQLGTADGQLALKAALQVADCIDAVDVNMGCPKPFSTTGGMGAALLDTPDVACEILRTLRRGLPADVGVSCKVRIQKTHEASVDFCRQMESCGIDAIAVHGRLRSHRPTDPAHWDEIRPICESLRIPVLANGDVFDHADVARICRATGARGVLVARGAMWNPSIFRAHKDGGPLEHCDVVRARFLRHAVDADNALINTKYCLNTIGGSVGGGRNLASPDGRFCTLAKNHGQLCAWYGVDPTPQDLPTHLVSDAYLATLGGGSGGGGEGPKAAARTATAADLGGPADSTSMPEAKRAKAQ